MAFVKMQSNQMSCLWCLSVLVILVTSPWGQGNGVAMDYDSEQRKHYCTEVLNQTSQNATNCGTAPAYYANADNDYSFMFLMCCLGGLGPFNVTYKYGPYMNSSLVTYISVGITSVAVEKKMAQYVQECGSKRNKVLTEAHFSDFNPDDTSTCP
nr:putative lineage-restricted protein [Crepidula fornicata]